MKWPEVEEPGRPMWVVGTCGLQGQGMKLPAGMPWFIPSFIYSAGVCGRWIRESAITDKPGPWRLK